MSFGKSLTVALFALIMLGSAYAAPGIPHQFYGFATINGNVANSANIVAKIGGTEVASTTTITNGNYGISPNIFYVTDPNNTNENKIIEFFLNGTSVATSTFKNGELTELNLTLGTAPTCGDSICSGGETCSSCESDCGGCGGSTPRGNTGGPSGGGGVSPSLTIKIEGECVGHDVTISTLNTYGNPAREASILIRSGNSTIFEEKTDDDGQIIFTFDEAGEYTIFANKQFYTQNSKTITISECAPGETTSTGNNLDTGNEGAGNLCENVNCNDSNPCTTESCSPNTGHCEYVNQNDGVSCSATGTCQEGICTLPEQPETGGEGTLPTGFFGLGMGQLGGLGLLMLALIAMAGYLFALNKRKKK